MKYPGLKSIDAQSHRAAVLLPDQGTTVNHKIAARGLSIKSNLLLLTFRPYPMTSTYTVVVEM